MTPRRLEVLRLVCDGISRNQFAPTMQEMADELGISKVTIFEHVEALQDGGMLDRRHGHARGLSPTDEGWRMGSDPARRDCVAMMDKALAAGKEKQLRKALVRLLGV